MWVSRLDGLRQFVNRAYHEFLGVPFVDALNFDWRKALHPDDLERILRDQRAGEGSRKPFVLEARYRRHDGQWRWLRSESQPRWGPAGEHIGFIGVAHDITASKEAEQALTELNETLERRIEDRTRQLAASEALIQTFFNHSSECYAVIVEEDDGQFRYAEANPATLRLYKKTPRGRDWPHDSGGPRRRARVRNRGPSCGLSACGRAAPIRTNSGRRHHRGHCYSGASRAGRAHAELSSARTT